MLSQYHTQKMHKLQQEAAEQKQHQQQQQSSSPQRATPPMMLTGGGFKSSGNVSQHQQSPSSNSFMNNQQYQPTIRRSSGGSSMLGGGIVGDKTTLLYNQHHHHPHHQSNQQHHMNGVRMKPTKFMVTYTVGAVGGQQHCFGVNSLALCNDSGTLFTAGRDSTIKAWSIDTNNNGYQHKRCFEDHTDWVNDIFLSKDKQYLVSSSSDSTIKIWNVNNGDTSCINTLSKHEDYVKSLAYSPSMNVFASSGLDSNIVLWDLNECTNITSINLDNNNHNNHSTKPLNSSVTTSTTISSSQNSNLEIDEDDDEEDLRKSSNSINQNNTNKPPPLYKGNNQILGRGGGDGVSIYSLAMNEQATIILAGSTGRTIHGWDIRAGQVVLKLKGHLDNVRSMAISMDGKMCVSASSDGTFKLWDVGMRKCIHTFDVHQDSVWRVVTDQSFSRIVTGGRDGYVYSTDIRTLESKPIVKEPHPILGLLLEEYENRIWVSTTDSTVKNWSFNGIQHQDGYIRKSNNINNSNNNIGSNNSNNNEPRFVDEIDYKKDDNNNNGQDEHSSSSSSSYKEEEQILVGEEDIDKKLPLITIKGRAGIIKHHLLNNRRHLLTRDTEDCTSLWDITKGELIESYGPAIDFDKKIEELVEIVSIPKWMSIDTKTGGINITLESSQCFKADVNLLNLGVTLQDNEEDSIYNIGERVLSSLFLNWKLLKYQHQQQQKLPITTTTPTNNGGKEDSNDDNNSIIISSQVTNINPIDSPSLILDATGIKKSSINGTKNNSSTLSSCTTTPTNSLTPNTSTNSIEGLLNCGASDKKPSSSSSSSSLVPPSNSQSTSTTNNNNNNTDKKLIFELPKDTSIRIWEETTGITLLRRSRLDEFTGLENNIPPWISECILHGIYKPAIDTKIIVQLIPYTESSSPVNSGDGKFNVNAGTLIRRLCFIVSKKLAPPSSYLSDLISNPNIPPEEYVEILCNRKVLLPKYTLQTVKSFFWKSSDILQLQYRFKPLSNINHHFKSK